MDAKTLYLMLKFMLNFLTQLFRLLKLILVIVRETLINLLRAHRAVLYEQYFPVRSISYLEPNHRKVHLLFVISVVLLANVYGSFGLYYEATGRLDLTGLVTSPYMHFHQCTPELIWPQYDIVMSMSIVASILYYASLIYTQTNDRYAIYQDRVNSKRFIFGQQTLSSSESAKMNKFCRKANLLLTPFIFSYLIMVYAFMYFNVWHHNVYRVNFLSLLYWLVAYPLFIFYIYLTLATLVYIIVACRLIRICQMGILNNLIRINQKFCSNKAPTKSMVLEQWLRFKALNKTLFQLCKHISVLRRVLTPRLSIILPALVITQGYFLFIYLYTPLPEYMRHFFITFLLGIYLFQFAIIRECANVDHVNRKIEQQMGRFYVRFANAGAFAKMNNKTVILKVEALQMARRLKSYAFNLFGNLRISSKTYNVIISYISAFFMFVIKHN